MSSAGDAPSVYQYGQSGQADQGAMSGISNLGSIAQTQGGFDPRSMGQTGQQIQQSVQGLPGFAGQALQNGFDPQNQLYGKLFQQQQDQTRANSAASGVAMTPYGTGLNNQADQNFNMGWQNNQLSRQAQGAQTAEGLLGRYGAGMQSGAEMGMQGGQFAQNTQQTQIQDYLNYLQGGTSASNAAVGAYQAQNSQSNSMFGGLGSLIGLGASFIPGGGPILGGLGGLF